MMSDERLVIFGSVRVWATRKGDEDLAQSQLEVLGANGNAWIVVYTAGEETDIPDRRSYFRITR